MKQFPSSVLPQSTYCNTKPLSYPPSRSFLIIQAGSSSSFMPSQTLTSPPFTPVSSTHQPKTTRAPLAVVGSLAVDITMHPFSTSPLQTTAPGSVSLTLGGVAGNVSRAAHSLLQSDKTLLIAPIGEDLLGSVAEKGLEENGMRVDGLIRVGADEGGNTATCGYLVDEKGELIGGVADMKIAREVEGRKVSSNFDDSESGYRFMR